MVEVVVVVTIEVFPDSVLVVVTGQTVVVVKVVNVVRAVVPGWLLSVSGCWVASTEAARARTEMNTDFMMKFLRVG